MINSSSVRSMAMGETPLRKLGIECQKINGINLAQGIIDTPPPNDVISSAINAIEKGFNSYTSLFGNEDLRIAISQKIQLHNNITYDPNKEIVITVGAAGAFFCACFGLLDPGDEIIVFEPYYPYHVDVLLALGIHPQFIRLNPPNWEFDFHEIRAKINRRTKAILINTPSNPTGKVFNISELTFISELAAESNLIVITDEVYEHFVYDNHVHISPATLPGLRSRTVTIGSLSKSFAITGWRVGYLSCKPEWAQALAYVNERVFVCAPSPLQVGVAKGLLSLPADYYQKLKSVYNSKRNRLVKVLERIGLIPISPQGTFYVLADIRKIPGNSALDKALYILEQTSVGFAPGSAFFEEGSEYYNCYARISFGVTEEKLSQAIALLDKLQISS